uniref:DUF7779 domain-containing protein n=1 Tax=Bionectria ochroleuca TaxID=29856 RepID=A0A8H7NHF5_BIOOC
MHPLGAAIFVFIGGTSPTFSAFKKININDPDSKQFAASNGPDFISRLRGYVNVVGTDPSDDRDMYPIRRAILLRALLEKRFHIEQGEEIKVDPTVANGLLKTPSFHHGARSLEAILSMSRLKEQREFQRAALPSETQLTLHVDSQEFMKHVRRRRNLPPHLCEKLAEKLHRVFREEMWTRQGNTGPLNADEERNADSTTVPWDKLPENLKESNRLAADDIVIKLLAIHGLNGHREKTWIADNGVHWLRSLLPNDLPNARILCWGYDANTHSSSRVSCQYLYDHAQTLVSDLSRKRKITKTSERPIIFIAHSLGGIVLKSALIHSDAAREGALLEHRSVKLSTYGILFMGTPHQGGNGVQLGRVLANVASIFISADDRLLKHLERDSEWLQQQLWQYGPISGDFVTKFAYEQYETPTLLGHSILVVPKVSAVVPGQADAEPIVIHADHISMVKFASKENADYKMVVEQLQIMALDAEEIVRSRWEAERRADNEVSTKYLIPYTSNPDFVRRSGILNRLKDQLGHTKENTGTSQARVSLYGLGGTGKTQIALAYVFWLQETYRKVSILWVHAGKAERFRQSFISIAEEYKIPGYADPKVDVLLLVKNWLRKKNHGEWLMVLDNADDTQLFFGQPSETISCMESNDEKNLARYLPECSHGTFLITTRNKQLGVKLTKGQQMIEVPRMNENESEQLLRARLRDTSATSAELSQLSSQLEHLPLALAQGAAFIQETGITVSKYLRMLGESDKDTVYLLSREFETVGRDSEAPQAVAETWMLSFQQIQQQHALASELLSFMSLLDRQDIPEQFMSHFCELDQTGDSSDEIRLTEALGILKAFSFVTEENSGSFDMHRLVQLVTRKRLASQGTISQVGGKALLTVSHVYPYGVYETRAICARYLSHASTVLQLSGLSSKDEAEAKASLYHCIAGYYMFEGKWTNAETSSAEAVKIREEVLGANHPDTLTSMANLASTYRNQGRWKEAEKLEVHVMETRKTKLGADHPDTLTGMANLASTYRNQGRWGRQRS